MPDQPAKLDRSRDAEAARLAKYRRIAEQALPPSDDELNRHAQEYAALSPAVRRRARAAVLADVEALNRYHEQRERQEQEDRERAEQLAREMEALAQWTRDIVDGRVPHLTAADLDGDGSLDVDRLRYLQIEREYGTRLFAELRRCRTRTHKPPSEKAATQLLMVRLFGQRAAARLVGKAPTTVQDAHDRVDALIRATPGARVAVDALLDDAEQWRAMHGPAGDVSRLWGHGSGRVIHTLRQDGTYAPRAPRKSV